ACTKQILAEGFNHFPFKFRRGDGVQIIGSDKTAPEKFQRSRNHSRILCRPQCERQNSDESSRSPARKDKQGSAGGQVLPPWEQPFMREEDAPGSARLLQCVPFFAELGESGGCLNSFSHHGRGANIYCLSLEKTLNFSRCTSRGRY